MLKPIKPNIAGTWHIVVEVNMTAEKIASTVAWLADMGDYITEAVEREIPQNRHGVRVSRVQCHFPEMTGEGYEPIPEG